MGDGPFSGTTLLWTITFGLHLGVLVFSKKIFWHVLLQYKQSFLCSYLAASVTEEWACASLVSVTNSFETCIQKNDCKRCISCHKNEIQICCIPNSSSQLFHYISSNTSTKLLVESSPLLDIVRMRSHGIRRDRIPLCPLWPLCMSVSAASVLL